jgi:hypothetical protein
MSVYGLQDLFSKRIAIRSSLPGAAEKKMQKTILKALAPHKGGYKYLHQILFRKNEKNL